MAEEFESSNDGAAQVRGLRRSEYEQLIDLGAFGDERVELVRGALLTMSQQGEPHARSVVELVRILVKQVSDEWRVQPRCGLAAWDDSMPEPDVAVVSDGSFDRHATRAVLVVEVSQTSLRFDRGKKAALYAEASIPTYWVVDLVGRAVHVHTDPRDGHYRSIVNAPVGESLAIDGLPGVSVPTAAIFPAA